MKHQLHRVNELYLAFVDRQSVPTRNQQAITFLVELLEECNQKKVKA